MVESNMFLIPRYFSLITYRTYAKWLQRRAVRVLTSEESEQFHSRRKNSPAAKPCINAAAVRNTLDSRINKENITFETLHVGDPRFGPVVTNAKSVTGREKKKIMLLEGRRLVNEAVQTSQRLQSVFFTDAELLEGLPLKSLAESGVKFYKVKKDHMNLWSDTVAPQGILAICHRQTRNNSSKVKAENVLLPLTLICDNIKDPGILGTLIRSAAAACCRTVLITKGCIDAWEPKVLRSGAGAHFHSHSIVSQVAWEQVQNYLSDEIGLLLVNGSSPEVDCSDRLIENRPNGRNHGKYKTIAGDPSRLSLVKFKDIDCGTEATALLVSGGLTADARQFAASYNGKLISFPTIDGKAVMNPAVSGSVALFEIVRQLHLQTVHTSDADTDSETDV